MMKLFNNISAIIYSFVAATLVAFALMIIGFSIYILFAQQLQESLLREEFILAILQTVGAIVIAVAIIDVAKYMIEEEVLKNKELRTPREARETLTKIIVIISIAVAVEGLIYIFKAGTKDIRLLVYPSILIISSTIMVIGLGVYQKLSTAAERKHK